jgi:hypothetical protein
MAMASTLVRVQVWNCQAVAFQADSRNPRAHQRGAHVDGTLLTGLVQESRSVFSQADPEYPVYPAHQLPAGQPASLFLEGHPFKACPDSGSDGELWLVTIPQCCDVMPMRGLCLVPRGIPIATAARRADWHPYEPPVPGGR